MQRLREATRVAHDRIEKSLPLLDPSLTTATYLRVLQAFHGFYAPLEPRLSRAVAGSGLPFTLEDRTKVPLLSADLGALGMTAADVEALPRCADLPRVSSASQALGVLYVVEGATLGGRIILRHLRGALELDAARGAAFFAGYGERTGEMWTRFSRHVDESPSIDTERVVGAAVETFDKLRSWIDTTLARA
ncbi:MAG: biliverdin-producing heme oxygenase [Polyangiales bacterium]